MNNLPLCARIGVLHGLIVGFFFSLWRMETAFQVFAADEFAWGVLLLSTFALLCSLFVLIIVERYLGSAVFWPAVVNVILVAIVTTLLINLMPPHRFFLLLGVWIGILVGLVIGFALCRLCLDRLTQGIGGSYGR
jgi:hypothetical protein